jgi:hypothetical protein
MNRSRRGMISDEEVTDAVDLIERSGVADWLEAELHARRRRPGRPRGISVMALMCAMLLLATDDRPLHLSAATDVLFCRLGAGAKASLGIDGHASDRRSFLARYVNGHQEFPTGGHEYSPRTATRSPRERP